MTGNKFDSFSEMTKVLSETSILNIVNDYYGHRRQQQDYHRIYNEKKKIALQKFRKLEQLGIDVDDLINK